jgi:hypothetical protein
MCLEAKAEKRQNTENKNHICRKTLSHSIHPTRDFHRARLARNRLPAPGRPRSSATALALSAVTSGGVRLLGGDGLVLGSGSVGDISGRDCGGLGLGDVDSRGVWNFSDHRLGLNPSVRLDDWRFGADLMQI